MKCYEISQNDLRRNFAKFREIRTYKFREISRNFAKFREINNVFCEIPYFAKLWKPTFVATLIGPLPTETLKLIRFAVNFFRKQLSLPFEYETNDVTYNMKKEQMALRFS